MFTIFFLIVQHLLVAANILDSVVILRIAWKLAEPFVYVNTLLVVPVFFRPCALSRQMSFSNSYKFLPTFFNHACRMFTWFNKKVVWKSLSWCSFFLWLFWFVQNWQDNTDFPNSVEKVLDFFFQIHTLIYTGYNSFNTTFLGLVMEQLSPSQNHCFTS